MRYLWLLLLIPLTLPAQPSCPDGLVANSFVNRCLTTEAASRVRQSENACMQKTGLERNQCFEQAAAGEVARKEEAGELEKNVEGGKFAGNKTWSMVLNGLAVGASAIVLINSQESPHCKGAYSLYALGGAGLVSVVGEIWSSVQYGGKLDDIKGKFKTLEQDSQKDGDKPTATNIQIQAFEVMADQQELLGNIAESKKGWYTASFVGYTAAAGIAAFEIGSTLIGGSVATECANLYANASTIDDAPRSEVDEYLKHYFDSSKKVAYRQWQRQVEQDRSYHFNPTNAEELLFQLTTIYKLRMPNQYAMGIDDFDNYQRVTAGINSYGGGIKLLNQLVDLLIFPKAHAQAKAAFEVRKAGATGVKCSCDKPAQTGTEMTYNYQACDFGQDDLKSCIGAGSKAGAILNSKGVGTISSVDALSGKYGKGSVATAEKSRSLCAQYLTNIKCTASTVPTTVTKHITTKLIENIVLRTAPQLKLADMIVPPQIKEQAQVAVKAVTTPAYGGVVKFLASPYTRLAMSGLMATYSKVTMDHYGKQKAVADTRRDYLLNMKQQVSAGGEAFGCGSRDDLTNPNCYCYSEGGTLNPGRTNSPTCKHLFGGKPGDAQKKPGANTVANKGQACVSKTALDLGCSCRQTNTCMSVGLRAVNMPANLASSVATAQGLTNGLLNGSLDAVEVGKFDSVAYAAGMNKITDDLLKNNPQALAKIKKAKEDITKLNGNLDRGLSSISNGKLNANSLPIGGMDNVDLGNSKLASLGKMPSDSLPKSATGTSYEGSAGAATSRPAGGLGVSDNFDLGSTTNPTAVIEETPKFEDEKFELKVFDINDNPEENLFDIVSHRYQKTGMRLLFENPTPEGVPVESAPAETSGAAAP